MNVSYKIIYLCVRIMNITKSFYLQKNKNEMK